ncbi:MAG TPA: Asp-tRNA(Asn)/Glu-tRNA(Gln) amidotransferase subunit GatC [Candidatus Omnitrophota bacterium]|nr:Asp-tRNA(Asn)/Glu-tRNA(Gln) amidotransferase subunit GatC [Candidatus Omnitrophota bacterium]
MLSKEEVRYIAGLSRIHLEKKEVDYLTGNLANILDYIDQLKKLDISGVAPTTHVLPIQNVYRGDQVKPSFSSEEAVKISPHASKGFFKVPQVIE